MCVDAAAGMSSSSAHGSDLGWHGLVEELCMLWDGLAFAAQGIVLHEDVHRAHMHVRQRLVLCGWLVVRHGQVRLSWQARVCRLGFACGQMTPLVLCVAQYWHVAVPSASI